MDESRAARRIRVFEILSGTRTIIIVKCNTYVLPSAGVTNTMSYLSSIMTNSFFCCCYRYIMIDRPKWVWNFSRFTSFASGNEERAVEVVDDDDEKTGDMSNYYFLDKKSQQLPLKCGIRKPF